MSEYKLRTLAPGSWKFRGVRISELDDGMYRVELRCGAVDVLTLATAKNLVNFELRNAPNPLWRLEDVRVVSLDGELYELFGGPVGALHARTASGPAAKKVMRVKKVQKTC